MKNIVLAAFLAAVPTSALLAQTATPIEARVTTNAVLRAGTSIQLRLLETLTTKEKQLRVGQRFNLEVAAPVEVNGVVVIPQGANAVGEVTAVRNKGMWGKSGHLTARLLFVRVNGRQIRLAGTFDDKGKTGTAGVVGAVAFVPVAGFFLTGTSATVPTGTEIPAFIDEDVELAIQDTPRAPMVVEHAAPQE